MCIDDGCDELICCLCAPLAAVLCCKLCKDKMGPNNVQQAPESGFYPSAGGQIPASGVYGPQGYGPRINQQPQFYPGGPQPHYPSQHPNMQGDYYPPHQGYTRGDLPPVFVKQQPRPYQ